MYLFAENLSGPHAPYEPRFYLIYLKDSELKISFPQKNFFFWKRNRPMSQIMDKLILGRKQLYGVLPQQKIVLNTSRNIPDPKFFFEMGPKLI